MMTQVYQKIAEKIPKMSKAQEKIAKYILENKNSTPFLTVEKLANLSGVSIATVTRFVIFLGYKGYPEFLKDTQESIKQQVNNNEMMKLSFKKGKYESNKKNVYGVFEDDIDNIRLTMKELNINELKKAVNILLNAKRIFITARRSSLSIAVFLKYYLDLMFSNVTLIENIEQIPKQINTNRGEDVVIGVNFDKYSRSTAEIFTHLKNAGAAAIAITDSFLSPLVPYADVTLTAAGRRSESIDSLVGPLSLINILLISIEQEKEDYFNNSIHMLEETWKKFELII